MYQLTSLCEQHARELITTEMEHRNITARSEAISGPAGEWIDDLWTKIIIPRFSTEDFEDMDIFPARVANGHIRLVSLNNILMSAVECEDKDLVNQTFEQLGVTVLYHMPEWCNQQSVMKYIYPTSADGIMSVLSLVKEDDVNNYNSNATDAYKNSFRKYLKHILKGKHLTASCKKVILKLKIFPSIESSSSDCELVTANTFNCYSQITNFPIKFPVPVIRVDDDSERQLLSNIDVQVFGDSDMVRLCLQMSSSYMTEDVRKVMYWLMQSEQRAFLRDTSIMDLASNIRFLLNSQGTNCLACELFDPTDPQLNGIFMGDAVFPIIPNGSNIQMQSLNSIGLKRMHDIKQSDIHQALVTTEQLSQTDVKKAKEKSKTLMSFLNKKPEFLPVETSMSIRWIWLEFDDRNYPSCIPLKNREAAEALVTPSHIFNSEQANLVGSVAYLQNCGNIRELERIYQWNKNPTIEEVVAHLAEVVQSFEVRFKTDCLKMITDIYQYLNLNYKNHQDTIVTDIWAETFDEKNLPSIWDGNGFSSRGKIYVESRDDDVHLGKYMRSLPSEMLSMKEFCRVLGCQEQLDFDTYLKVLEEIKIESDNCLTTNVNETIKLVIDILTKISEDDFFNSADESQISRIYIPIETESPKKLQLKCVKNCALIDLAGQFGDQAFDVEDEVYFIHCKVPESTARKLGVRSAMQQMLADGDLFEEWGQQEPLTRRLRVLLQEGYVEGMAIAKEMLQNADDARASKMYILYDERTNQTLRDYLMSPALEHFQGPAIWIYNDAEFSETDFINITKLNGATKEKDASTIGKFGLGFCSVYNITDVPSFVSQDSYVIFDPHMTHLGNAMPGKNPGLRLRLSNERNLRTVNRMINQFKVFDDIFGCQLTSTPKPYFQGTLFRLPLRESPSDISSRTYRDTDIKDLLSKIIKMAPNMFLFNQNVQEMKIFHLPKANTPDEINLIYEVSKSTSCIPRNISLNSSVVNEIVKLKTKQMLYKSYYRFIQTVTVSSETRQNSYLNTEPASDSRSWFVSWATGTQKNTMQIAQCDDGALPLAAVAVISSGDGKPVYTPVTKEINGAKMNDGRYFFFLPLPIENNFAFHINGQFTVTSDRRQIMKKTEDDMNDSMQRWNVCLMEDVVVNALIHLLQECEPNDKNRFSVWPVFCDAHKEIEIHLSRSFYRNIIQNDYKVFHTDKGKVSFSQTMFLHPSLRANHSVGNLTFRMVEQTLENHVLVDIPETIFNDLYEIDKSLMQDKTITVERFALEYFVPNIAMFEEEDRNTISLHLIGLISEITALLQVLKNAVFVPTVPNGKLQRPGDLIDPRSLLKSLFSDIDERFPIELFSDGATVERLQELGMMTTVMPDSLIEDRARNIQTLSESCSSCAFDRCLSLLQYFENTSIQEGIALKLINIPFIPVEQQPDDWTFVWNETNFSTQSCNHHKANERRCCFKTPASVFVHEDMWLVGCHSSIVEHHAMELMSEYTISQLQIKHVKDSDFQLVIKQIECLAQSATTMKVLTSLKPILEIYMFLNNYFASNNYVNTSEEIKQLKQLHFIFVDGRFVSYEQVSLNHKGGCKPYLFGVSESTIHDYEHLCKEVNFKEDFSADDINKAIKALHIEIGDLFLSEDQFILAKQLLMVLYEALERCEIDWSYFDKKGESIYVPDETKSLKNSRHLCFDEFNSFDISDEDFCYVNSDIPEKHAKLFGVRSIKHQMLSETDAFEEWGQEEPLTRRIKVLLEEGYVDGFSVAKELLQNADDAGATEICFLYDERQNESMRKDLLCKEMSEFQGPALWVYNNATFTEEDFVNITKLNGGTKTLDTTKIGTFGLGFCSVYNVTDLPSFVSGNNYVVFDPHATHLQSIFADQSKKTGLRINFAKQKNRRVLNRMKHQFQIYDGLFECQLTTKLEYAPFQGTLFRFPLRKHPSEISDKVYDRREVKELIQKIIQCAPSMFIFNQHVKQLKIYHQDDSDTLSPRRLCFVRKSSTIIGNPGLHVVEFSAGLKKEGKLQSNPLNVLEKVSILITKDKCDTDDETMAWLVSWASGTDQQTFEIATREQGALPLGAVAVPMNPVHLEEDTERIPISCDDFEGQYFYYMPLPINNHLKFHINAQFSVTSDRRHLNLRTSDDKESSFTDWNRRLMEDVVLNAFIFLLEKIQTTTTCALWPLVEKNVTEKWFRKSFYKSITDEHRESSVFCGYAENTSFNRTMFLDPKLRTDSNIGQIAFELLAHVLIGEDKFVMDINESYYFELHEANPDSVEMHTVTAKDFYIKYFLRNIYKFEDQYAEKRNLVICHILMTQVDEEVLNALKETKCIPTQPHYVLRMPRELVDISGIYIDINYQRVFPLEGIFSESDERFPIDVFSDHAVLLKLRKLGMMHELLPNDIVLDRAHSIIRLYKTCSECTLHRYKQFMKYMEYALSKDKDIHVNIQQQLQDIPFALLLNRPNNWIGPWASGSNDSSDTHCKVHIKPLQGDLKLESVRLAKPIEVFSYGSRNLVGCHAKVLSDTFSSKEHEVEQYLGIRHVSTSCIDGDSVNLVCTQLEILSTLTTDVANLPEIVLTNIYTFLDKACAKSMTEIMSRRLRTHAVIFEKDRFVKGSVIAKALTGQCKPYLYRLSDTMLNDYYDLIKMFDITEAFSLSTYADILAMIHNDTSGRKLTEPEFEVCTHLLENLCNEMLKLGKVGEDFDQVIYAPNINSQLFPSTDLCFDDINDLDESESMNFISDRLTKRVCKAIGIKEKKMVFLKDHSEDIEDFYQEETLVNRIKRLIEGYPLDTGLFKELLQNADDAGASEIVFILDRDTHAVTDLLNNAESMKPHQGPALCVWNDKGFTKKDLQGIQRLGQGSKESDFSKTGKYGVGFNALYNVTDIPSFLTKGQEIEGGETLCFFDPLATTLPGVSRKKPGRRIKNVNTIMRKKYPSSMLGYHEQLFFKGGQEGTIFRFPLRKQPSDISRTCIDVKTISDLFQDFSNELSSILTFLKHVCKITIGELQKERFTNIASVEMQLDDNNTKIRNGLTAAYLSLCSNVKNNKLVVLNGNPVSVVYRAKVCMEKHNTKPIAKELVISQTLGFSKRPNKLVVRHIENGDIGHLPIAGAAVELVEGNERRSSVSCFLPLPVKSGVPAHVHGNFALDHETRRSLWHDKELSVCFRTQWNNTLIEDVLSSAYVNLFKAVRDEYTSQYEKGKHELMKIEGNVKSVLQIIPLKYTVNGVYWELLAKSFVRQLVQEQIPFLPSFEITETESSYSTVQAVFDWKPYLGMNCNIPAFNRNETSSEGMSTILEINNSLRKIGMTIVKLDKALSDTVEFAGMPVESVSPKSVISFLVTYKKGVPGTCTIKTDVKVKESNLETIATLTTILKYILRDKECFRKHIRAIPMFLDNNNIVRVLEDSAYMFVTSHYQLCPQRADLFLHQGLVKDLGKKIKQTRKGKCSALKKFTLLDFAHLARNQELVPRNKQEYVHWNRNEITNDWMTEFWLFFNECYKKSKNESSSEKVQSLLDTIHDLSIIPVCINSDKTMALCSPLQLYSLVTISTFSQSLQNTLRKVQLPSCAMKYGLELLEQNTATANNIDNFVKCLFHHKDLLRQANLTKKDSSLVLRLLNDNIQAIKSIDKVKSLPIFLSYDGRRVSLESFKEAYIAPYGMPDKGIDSIISRNNILLLRENSQFKEILKVLDVQEENILNVYMKFILPNHMCMTSIEFYSHVKFLARHRQDNENDPLIPGMLTSLRHLSFIETNFSWLTVSQLFDKDYPIFQIFCENADFLPHELQDSNLKDFMVELGLVTELEMNHFIRFGKMLEQHASSEGVDEDLRKRSQLLFTHLVSMEQSFFRENSFEQIKQIAFVTPWCPDNDLISIHDAAPEHKNLVKLVDTVVYDNRYVCWTTTPIISLDTLHTDADTVRHTLGISTMPNSTDWIQHCTNVGRGLEEKLRQAPAILKCEVIIDILEHIYTSARYYDAKVDLTRLREVPLIFFQEQRMVVVATSVVLDIAPSYEIPPFLVKAPVKFGKHFELFLKLGATDKPTAATFAYILSSFVENQMLMPQEYFVATTAMKYMFRKLFETKENIKNLVVVCCDKKVRRATCTVINDDVWYASRLKDCDKNIPFVSGFGFEDKPLLERNVIRQCVRNLPQSSQPFLLSNIIQEEVDMSNFSRVPSPLEQTIESYIKSVQFKRCFIRLVRHSVLNSDPEETWTEELELQLENELEKITLVCGTGINTILRMRSIEHGNENDLHDIEGSTESKWVHIRHSKEADVVEVMFDIKHKYLQDNITMSLTTHLLHVTNGRLAQFESILLLLLNYNNVEERNISLLDYYKILPYDAEITKSLFYPVPGSFVPKEFHMYLDNGYGFITEFQYRFIALLLEDPALEDNVMEEDDMTSSYIFVTVLEKVGISDNPLFQKYKIDDGSEETKTVEGFMLYTFVRRKKSDDRSVVLYDKDSVDSQNVNPLDLSIGQVCKEIRTALVDAWTDKTKRKYVIRKLMLQWHPDKNPDRIEIATKAFQYFQQCIHCLERGLGVPEYTDNSDFSDGGSARNGESSFYNRFWDRHRRRSGGGDGGSACGGRDFMFEEDPFESYAKYEREQPPHPYPAMARRWQTQARFDVEEAERNLDDTNNKGNWICYKAHQVK